VRSPVGQRPLTRAYRLGFSATPPRLELASVLQTIEEWTRHGDVALVLLQPPWRSLLADTSAAFLVRRDQAELVALYRRKGLPVIAMIDATDGLARDKEGPELAALWTISNPSGRGGGSTARPAPSLLSRLYRFGRHYRFAAKAQGDFHEERREGGSVRLAIPQLRCVALHQR
jgi:hypothetical protein